MDIMEDRTRPVLIILFTRFPLPGQTKTRLIPSLGCEGAAELQRKMTEFTVDQIRQTGWPMQIRYTGGTLAEMQNWLGRTGDYVPQGPGDLGQRMARAFEEAFNAGASKVLLIGSDCPDNRADNLQRALRQLDAAPCVIGPAVDGGYYLLGLTAPCPALFENIAWGTEAVFRQTTAKLSRYVLLPTLNDVDRAEDVPESISVVVPTLNESESIKETVRAIRQGFDTEAVVVDGGSRDRTSELALRAGARVVNCLPGRARQMNAGAQKTSGEILLFLHGDSKLPPAWDRHLRETMKRPGARLGYFRFALQESFPGSGLITFGTNARARLLGQPYGDQGLFLRRKDFMLLGGFPDVPILEDLLLVKNAKKHGAIACANAALATSGRRWRQYGPFRTWLMNQSLLLAARLGADLDKLGQAYRAGKNPLRALWR